MVQLNFPRRAACLGLAVTAILGPVTQALAETPRETIGSMALFTNDTIGDRQDRWRTGAFSYSVIRAPGWDGALPSVPFSVMEYRFRGEAISPDNTRNPARGDRLYAGTLWLGAHTHYALGGYDITAGADIAVTGEQSGVRSFQASLHDLFSMSRVGLETYQVEDGVYLHATLEIARPLSWQNGEFRPFVELQGGVETMARAGFDLTLGSLGQGGLRLRDPITGQRIAAVTGLEDQGGWSVLFGADTAYVDSSVFLPEDRGFRAEEDRHRARLGVNYGLGLTNIFYGITWASEEFVGQPESQAIGSLSFDIRF